MIKLKVRRGDEVIVVTGKDRGKKGKVLKVIPGASKVVVAGINIVKKHMKATQHQDGGIIQKELPLHISNVAHIDPKSGKATKVAIKILEDGTKVRVAKISGEIIGKEGKK
jgi:large subunit ribosomal protein L24